MQISYKLTNVFYEIDFSDGESLKTLRYQIVDTPVSRAWLNQARLFLSNPKSYIFEQRIVTLPNSAKIYELWKRLKFLVDEVNSGKYVCVEHIDMPNEYDPLLDSQKILNHLHSKFHIFEESTKSVAASYNPLRECNTEIHKIEAMISSINSAEQALFAGFFLHFDGANDDIKYKIVDDSLYRYFDHDACFGDLLLGYNTVGKNIYHCWKDNDIDVVKKNMVRPQQTISNEVLLFFNRQTTSAGNSQKIREKILAWLINNNLTQYVDMSAAKNQAVSSPLLGRLVNCSEFSKNDINAIFSLGNIAGARLVG